jgi:hypothetical protein
VRFSVDPDAADRLASIAVRYDPEGLLVANHPVG